MLFNLEEDTSPEEWQTNIQKVLASENPQVDTFIRQIAARIMICEDVF